MSITKSPNVGNRKGHRTPSLRELRIRRLVRFWDAQWNELQELTKDKKHQIKKHRKNKHKAPKENIDFNILLPSVPTEEPIQNIWKLSSDEQHLWGDLTREEDFKLKKIIKS